MHPDLKGLTFFDAGGDGSVPAYGPVFSALKKRAFAFHDTPKTAYDAAKQAQMAVYEKSWMSPKKKVEELLLDEVPLPVQRRFLKDVKEREDYPSGAKVPADDMTDADVRKLVNEILLARKGEASGYAAILVSHCQTDTELPPTIRAILADIHTALSPPIPTPEPQKAASDGQTGI